MAIDDLDALKEGLPEVFAAKPLPPGWETEWIRIRIDDPESPVMSEFETDLLGGLQPGVADASDDATSAPYGSWPKVNPTPDIPGRFPGSPDSSQPTSPYPPPDALAFYLPFHYFFPEWWGIYLTVEGVAALAGFIASHTGGVVTRAEAGVISRFFLYGHESYHHAVECFATRLEVTHREPLYRLGFETLYQKTIGTDDAHEEALANAKAYRLANRVARRVVRGDVAKRRRVQAALDDYIKGCPPGYRRGVEVAREFKQHERQFSEDNHHEALPSLPTKKPTLWATFPYAIAGIARRISRVNYVVPRSSPLALRLPVDLRYLTYGDLVRKLKALAKVTFVRPGKGSHEIWRSPAGGTVVIPRHLGDLGTGTLAKIIKQSGLAMSVDEFLRA